MQQQVKTPDIIKQITDNFDKTLTLSHHHDDHNHHENHDDDDDNDDDFEFFIEGDRNSPISADDIFQNGQIRPIFPFSGEMSRNSDGAATSVRKLFVASSPEKENAEIRNSSISADDIFQNGQIRSIFPFSGEKSRKSGGATTSYPPPEKGNGEIRNSSISADDFFQNGQIRPMFSFSGEKSRSSDGATTSYPPPVRKLFVASSPEKENGEIPEGPYCEWSPEKSTPVPEMSRKSNSTGFSKLWRVRDLLVRSHSDGKDTFVFLGKSEEEEKKRVKVAAKIRVSKGEKEKIRVSQGEGKEKGKKSAYEVLYGKKNKERKGGKSYLPYRPELVGFFTNASGGMSKNVHPY